MCVLGMSEYSCVSQGRDTVINGEIAHIAKDPPGTYRPPKPTCPASWKDCNGCRGYLSSCCSSKNCDGGRVCRQGKKIINLNAVSEPDRHIDPQRRDIH